MNPEDVMNLPIAFDAGVNLFNYNIIGWSVILDTTDYSESYVGTLKRLPIYKEQL